MRLRVVTARVVRTPQALPTGLVALAPFVPSPPVRALALRGLPGPPGPAGASGAGFVHVQPTPSAEWTIAHNLGFEPAVSVRTTGGVEVDAEVLNLTSNTLKIYFAVPMAGTARLV